VNTVTNFLVALKVKEVSCAVYWFLSEEGISKIRLFSDSSAGNKETL
jgi:hypothetical protein